MNIFRSRFLLVAGLVGTAGLLVNVNCSSSGGGGTGGTTGTGGTIGSTGGNKGTGGTGTGGTGTGGSATGGSGGHATGGSGGAATGGSGGAATGGAAGGASGGAAGGSAGAAGGAAGGSTGVGGAITGTALATFDPTDAGATAELDGFAFVTGGTGNLADATDAVPAATLTWDGTDGDPADGSLKVDAPFNAYNEYVNLQKGYANTNLQDWTGKTKLHVRVRINSGLNPSTSFPPGIQPYVTSYGAPTTDGGTASYNYCGNYQNAVAGNGWADYTVTLTPGSSGCSANLDVSKILNFGVQIQTGGGAAADASQPADPTAAIVHIDSFYVD